MINHRRDDKFIGMFKPGDAVDIVDENDKVIIRGWKILSAYGWRSFDNGGFGYFYCVGNGALSFGNYFEYELKHAT